MAAIIHYYNEYIRSKKVQIKKENFSLGGLLKTSLSLSIAALFVLLAADGDYSLWYIVYSLIPGASAIRAVSRYLMFLCLPIGVLLAYLVDDFCTSRHGRRNWMSKGAAILFIVILIIENMTSMPFGYWNISDRKNFLESVPTPPENCNIMYVISNEDRSQSHYQLDAWEIANKYNLNTINGYSGQVPNGWSLRRVGTEDYQSYVDQWCLENGLETGVYFYDEDSRQWILHEVGYYLNHKVYPYNSEKIAFSSAEITEEAMVIYPGGHTYGPYTKIEAGEWSAVITGDNLNNAEINMHYDLGHKPIEFDIVQVTKEKIELEFILPETITDYELLIKNISDAQDVIFDQFELIWESDT